MAKITRTQRRRLVASSIALILTAVIMTPTTTDARGGGHGGGHHGGVRHIGILGFPQHHVSPAQPGFSVAFRRFHGSSRHAFSQRPFASRRSRAFGSDFVGLAAPNGLWLDNVGSAPTILFTQDAPITQEVPGPRSAAVKAPDAEQEGILIVRGNSKAYVTFPSGKPG